jgi:hypothetical protein
MIGLQKKECPTDQYGNCFWCEQRLRDAHFDLSDVFDAHADWCPWREVLAYKFLDDEWEVHRGRGEARVPQADGDRAGEGPRPVD